MNSIERFTQRLQGMPVDRVPNFNIMMTFAAHFIKQPLSRYYLDYHVLCEANLAVINEFSLDIVQAISDPYREAADIGSEIIFPEDNLPICVRPLIEHVSDLQRISSTSKKMGARSIDRLSAVRYLSEKVDGEIPVMGWAEGALAQAATLRGIQQLLLDMYDQPDFVHDLLEICLDIEIDFVKNQILAGAEIIGIGDSIASQIGPKMYRQFGLPYERRIFDVIRAAGVVGRLHICGDITRILSDVANCGADIIDIDSLVDINDAVKKIDDRAAICGNINPVQILLQGTPQQVKKSVFSCLRLGGSRLFCAAGCEIPDKTPNENLLAQVEALEEYGKEN